jgi:uncharacterized protein YdaU (DUF1376 family)
MSRPWMPLYVADYLADTAHLRAAESGAYLHLIMHYWQHGGLPQDDRQLTAIARMSSAEWRRARGTLAAFFTDGWKHKRIEVEIEEAKAKYEARAKAGQKGGKAKAGVKQNPSNATANDLAGLYQPQPPSVPNGTGAEAPPDPKKELFDRGRQVLGRESGGLISKLLRACGPEDDPKSIAKARARIEDASTKANPAEWLGRVLAPRAGSPVLTESGQPWPEGIV